MLDSIAWPAGPTQGICLKFTTFLRASAVLLMLYAGLMNAAVAQDKASRSALIIGVSTYSVPEIPTLKGVPFDITRAKEIAGRSGTVVGTGAHCGPDPRLVAL